jgi:hypothetical protein
VFASVYNQTLKDLRDCLLTDGWRQDTLDEGPCIPRGAGGGECIRRFIKGHKFVWLYSNLEKDTLEPLKHFLGSAHPPQYEVGLQTQLDDEYARGD